MTHPIKALASISLGLLVVGCGGGPNLRFDPVPSPGWINQLTQVEGSHVRAVGATRATPQVAADSDLAKRKGLQEIAASIQAQVVGRTNVWNAEASSGDTREERALVVTDVQVRTQLAVEGARVDKEYRDEASKTHYALVSVDKSAWASKVAGRLTTALNALERAVAKAGDHLKDGRVFKAMGAVTQAKAMREKGSVDVMVVEVLAGAIEQVERAQGLWEQLADAEQALTDSVAFNVEVSGGTAKAREETQSKIETFLRDQELRIGSSAPQTVRVKLQLGHDAGRTQRVGSRTDHLVNARGSLRVIGADGREVSKMSFDLSGDRYQARHRDASEAANAADSLAGHTLVSQFRSRFRKLVR